ncbi:MAG: glycosyltransferase family 4 protein [Bacteroidota bacterium]
MNICFICPEYPEGPHGGVGTMTRVLARELVRMGNEVRVIGVYPESYPSPDYEEDQGVKVWRVRSKKGKFGWIGAWRKQYKIVRKWANEKEIEIVEAPDSCGWFGLWRNIGVPLVLRSNGSNTYFAKVLNYKPNRLTKFLESSSYKKAFQYISASMFTAIETQKVFNLKKDFTIIYNGIEIPKIENNLDSTKRHKNKIVFAGTLIEKKGVVELVKAAKILHKENIEFVLEIYGKDTVTPERGSMIDFLSKNLSEEIRKKIIFKGHVTREELFQLYQNATCAIYPSYAEAFALAPLEAMACACPVINTKLGSGCELIVNNEEGLLIDPREPAEIANALKKVISEPEFASKIGSNGLKKVKNSFSKEVMAEQTISCFQKTISDYNIKFGITE